MLLKNYNFSKNLRTTLCWTQFKGLVNDNEKELEGFHNLILGFLKLSKSLLVMIFSLIFFSFLSMHLDLQMQHFYFVSTLRYPS